MAILAQLNYVGVSQEDYDSMMPQVEPRLRAARGFIAHLSEQKADGWQVFEVWESQEALNAWLREEIAPAMSKAGGSMPAVQTHPIHYLLIKGKDR
jgi:heme-degrading monooxygenase HmoA